MAKIAEGELCVRYHGRLTEGEAVETAPEGMSAFEYATAFAHAHGVPGETFEFQLDGLDVPDDQDVAELAGSTLHLVETSGWAPTPVSDLLGSAPEGDVLDISAKVDDVLAWVDSDIDRARQALGAELEKGDDARTTMVAQLTAMIDHYEATLAAGESDDGGGGD
jgi:hypothetical protein